VERYGGGRIAIVEYDPAWPAMFEDERAVIRRTLGALVVNIEPIGSTAVEGLPSKPIIDLLVTVRSLAEARTFCVAPLEALGYTYMPEYESWLPEELFFRKRMPAPWTHHVHVVEPSHARRQEWLLFRDYLRAHADVARAYAELKKTLAETCGEDIACYRTGKNAFVQSVVAKARAEIAQR